MKIMYKTSTWGTPITPIKVVKETDNCVFTEKGKELKVSRYNKIVGSIEDAKLVLIAQLDKAISEAKSTVEYREKEKAEMLEKLKSY